MQPNTPNQEHDATNAACEPYGVEHNELVSWDVSV